MRPSSCLLALLAVAGPGECERERNARRMRERRRSLGEKETAACALVPLSRAAACTPHTHALSLALSRDGHASRLMLGSGGIHFGPI